MRQWGLGRSLMTERRESQEISRAARQMADAARELSRSVARLSKLETESLRSYRNLQRSIEHLGERGVFVGPTVLPAPPLSDEEAVLFAVQSVREVREELWADREAEAPAPGPEEIEQWERERQLRREKEGYDLP